MTCGRCKIKEAVKGAYCQECFDTYKVGKFTGRRIYPNGKCHICEIDVPPTETFCEECLKGA